VTGVGQEVGRSSSVRGATFFFSEPGTYRFTIPKLDGYQPVPEQEVVVEKGKITDVVVRLEREP
jgi:hypothetical protein